MSDERRAVTISRDELDAILESAVERGAMKALERVGLHDEDPAKAAKDIGDLRDLIDGWRTVKRSALNSIGKAFGVALLASLAFLTGKFHFSG